MKQNIELRILLRGNHLGFYAQVLEHDLAAQGQTIDDALAELARVINVHIAVAGDLGREPFKSLGKAPREYWDLLSGAKRVDATLPDLGLVKCPPLESKVLVA